LISSKQSYCDNKNAYFWSTLYVSLFCDLLKWFNNNVSDILPWSWEYVIVFLVETIQYSPSVKWMSGCQTRRFPL